ncbi:MFS general substrate transporter [Diplogelasinospora grovesii]|uniref:MFS general substrate transporter n=1 Tax=Diplogelasinospora grovesii TaxID=303347 RepID=A0AAN6N7Z5_9PEZI|nr:MFS general substrate transporter [Diplogelasinospora grovesii]
MSGKNSNPNLGGFLEPLAIPLPYAFELSREFASTFKKLAAESADQFLSTPISETILRPPEHGWGKGCGGTNLRVAFIELLGSDEDADHLAFSVTAEAPDAQPAKPKARRLRRMLESSSPIQDHLKNENAESLFSWIGSQVAEVVQQGCQRWELPPSNELPMGVTFSFPMEQPSLSEATLMAMGKGFAITSKLDLGAHLVQGYEKHRLANMPPIRIAAISNDAVSTLVSFIYQQPVGEDQKAAMGLIVGTGCNATIPMKLGSLHESKWPANISVPPGQYIADVKVAVNTEWSIKGSAPPLRRWGLISRWDEQLDAAGESPGFQPLEYMTAGRYLGELGRIVFVDYLVTVLKISEDTLPQKMRQRFGLTTTFLSHFKPASASENWEDLLPQVEKEFPVSHGDKKPTPGSSEFQWTQEMADALYLIARQIERRAAGIIAAATVGLLSCAGELPPPHMTEKSDDPTKVLFVGYTGGCIQHFHNYLSDCQFYLDQIINQEYISGPAPVRVLLTACHDGGITGAGILHAAPSLHADSFRPWSHTHPVNASIPHPGIRPTGIRKHTDDDNDGDDERTPLLVDVVVTDDVHNGSAASVASDDVKIKTGSSTTCISITSSVTSGDGDTDNSPFQGVSRPVFWLLFAEIMATYFVASFDTTIMASSHPAITSHFGSSNSASWLSTAFLLTSTTFQPLVGRVSDAVGRKHPYVVTTAIFMLATLWCALARSMTSFVLARAVCGVGAGGMMTLGSIIVSDLVPIEIRGAYQSYINITYGAGAMLGAALGGAMADYLGWRWEFGVQVPVLAVCLVVAIVTIPDDLGLYGKKREGLREGMRNFDFAGSILMSVSVTFLILGLNLGGNVMPWSHPFVLSSLAIFAVFFPLFLWVETRAVRPIMPMHLIRSSPHKNLIFSNHIAAFVAHAILFNVPLFFQSVLLTSATTSGLRLVISSAVSSFTGAMTGFLITYTRRLKWPLILGSSLVLIGTFCLASMQRGWPEILYILALIPGSAGQGFQFPGTFMAILAVADDRDSNKTQAVVTSTLILWRSLGMVLGIAVTSLIVQNALVYFLNINVSAPDTGVITKERVVEIARQSVEAIKDLPEVYRDQVVSSYESAFRLTFLFCSLLALVSLLWILPVQLPRLKHRSKNKKDTRDIE